MTYQRFFASAFVSLNILLQWCNECPGKKFSTFLKIRLLSKEKLQGILHIYIHLTIFRHNLACVSPWRTFFPHFNTANRHYRFPNVRLTLLLWFQIFHTDYYIINFILFLIYLNNSMVFVPYLLQSIFMWNNMLKSIAYKIQKLNFSTIISTSNS